jgi:hypothetical protein
MRDGEKSENNLQSWLVERGEPGVYVPVWFVGIPCANRRGDLSRSSTSSAVGTGSSPLRPTSLVAAPSPARAPKSTALLRAALGSLLGKSFRVPPLLALRRSEKPALRWAAASYSLSWAPGYDVRCRRTRRQEQARWRGPRAEPRSARRRAPRRSSTGLTRTGCCPDFLEGVRHQASGTGCSPMF